MHPPRMLLSCNLIGLRATTTAAMIAGLNVMVDLATIQTVDVHASNGIRTKWLTSEFANSMRNAIRFRCHKKSSARRRKLASQSEFPPVTMGLSAILLNCRKWMIRR